MVKKMKNFTQNGKVKNLYRAASFACIALLLPAVSMAQGGFDVDSTGGGGDVIDVPLDNGTIVILAAGFIFGVYKLYMMSQAKKVKVS